MNLEFNPAEPLEYLTDEVSALLAGAVSPLASLPIYSAPSPADESEPEEFDDAVHFKTPTLNIDSPEEPSEGMFQSELVPARPKYIQGIVQAEQVYIITNLLGGESQIVTQPQMVWTIGRNREVALPVRDKAMSRRHAVVLYVYGVGFYLIDLHSMNGSYVNGVRIQHRHLLNDGDRVRIGGTEFTFFSSQGRRSVEAMHPEVLARLTASKSTLGQRIDFLALEEPELSFRNMD